MNISIRNLITDTKTVFVSEYFVTNIINIDTTNNFITITDNVVNASTKSLEPVIIDMVSTNEINNIIASN